MKSPIIRIADTDATQAVLDAAQQGVRARLLDADDLQTAAAALEARFETMALTQVERIGARATVGVAGSVASAYRGTPMSSETVITRARDGWRLVATAVWREPLRKGIWRKAGLWIEVSGISDEVLLAAGRRRLNGPPRP